MKYTNFIYLTLFILVVSIHTDISAQTLPYTEGTVWHITYVRTKPGMNLDYLRNLAAEWQKQNDELKKQGHILSYKILSGNAANQEDWDLMLMVEYKNYAALDGVTEKFINVVSKMRTEEQQKAGYINRSEMREILGNKVVRELILK